MLRPRHYSPDACRPARGKAQGRRTLILAEDRRVPDQEPAARDAPVDYSGAGGHASTDGGGMMKKILHEDARSLGFSQFGKNRLTE